MSTSTFTFGGRGTLAPFVLALALLPTSASAQSDPMTTGDEPLPRTVETIQVTATRVPEDVEGVPAAISVVSGDELRQRGVHDLAGALALVSGVTIAPGGDGGPAGSVPEMWGLREFDAFLLVVDGVPAGGAFNPALSTLSLEDVDRIEVLRGPAPVLYGATSFVGVIHVLHRTPDAEHRSARISGGSYGSGSAAASFSLPSAGGYHQSLSADVQRQGFKDDRTGFDRGHVLYRGSRRAGAGAFHLDFDGTLLRQDPASPHPRQGRVLSPLVPLDANHNPRGAHIDDDRLHLAGGYDRDIRRGTWSTTLAFTRTERDTLRGFLSAVANTADNARGFRQDLSLDDLYFDSHVALQLRPDLQLVAGFDHLFGRAEGASQDFDYTLGLNGSNAPSGNRLPGEMAFDVEDERNFSGLYAQTEWTPTARWRVQVGARLNRTDEDREAGERSLAGGGGEEEEEGKQNRTVTRGSGTFGVSWLAWGRDAEAVWLFADYRNTYKPAAIDFGPESEAEILKPETADSYEVGVKGRLNNGRIDWQVSAFRMDFTNLVVSALRNGLPVLINAGEERFEGAELEVRARLARDLTGQVAYSRHDATFTDSVQLFDNVPTRLDGNRLELSAKDLAAAGLIWAPARGLNGSLTYNWVGERFLNKRNTALAPGYSVWTAGIGYAFDRFALRLDGDNLSDERDPVAESELGDAQYYRLPARSFRVSLETRF
jgi:iron complex outermembrane recepter protein